MPIKKKVVKKVVAKRTINPLEQTMPMMAAKKQAKKVNPFVKATKGVNPFQTVASMNIPVPVKKVVKKKKKAVKKPKFNYSKSFTMK